MADATWVTQQFLHQLFGGHNVLGTLYVSSIEFVVKATINENVGMTGRLNQFGESIRIDWILNLMHRRIFEGGQNSGLISQVEQFIFDVRKTVLLFFLLLILKQTCLN